MGGSDLPPRAAAVLFTTQVVAYVEHHGSVLAAETDRRYPLGRANCSEDCKVALNVFIGHAAQLLPLDGFPLIRVKGALPSGATCDAGLRLAESLPT